MRQFGIIFLLVSSLAMLSCATTGGSRVKYISCSVEQFEKIIQREDVVLVDVRTPEEHQAGAITSTDVNLNVRSATFFSDYKQLPKDKTIALYCKGGGRSKQVAGVLAGNGYQVVELNSGYDGWVKYHSQK